MSEMIKTVYIGKRVIIEITSTGRLLRNGIEVDVKCNNSGYKYSSYGLIHRLVAMAFIENPENKPCVDHIDGNVLNNNMNNLRWVTYSENMMNPITRERNSKGQNWQKGENNPMYGYQWSDEQRKNMSKKMKGNKANLGRKFDETWRNNISNARKGLKLSPESLALRRKRMEEKRSRM